MVDIVLSITIMLLALLIYKKEYIFLMGYIKKSKDYKKIKDKKKLSKDIAKLFFTVALIFLITSILNDFYFDGDFDVLLDFFVVVLLFPIWIIDSKVRRGEY
ncbi:DUF3784 domain-containing protein [Senegalia sp. (in: firmicutes)]|uniref:DUF3784 domain-containing protein n=1 Tax=Senegalia sp. (in: firmicutes) TaxID=1924098 RepID=UPI003F966451